MTSEQTALPRFLTLGGAVVEIFAHSFKRWDGRIDEGHAWRCLGCDVEGAAESWTDSVRIPAPLPKVRTAANAHASLCRSMPRKAADA